jgi:hypothetical protein
MSLLFCRYRTRSRTSCKRCKGATGMSMLFYKHRMRSLTLLTLCKRAQEKTK